MKYIVIFCIIILFYLCNKKNEQQFKNMSYNIYNNEYY